MIVAYISPCSSPFTFFKPRQEYQSFLAQIEIAKFQPSNRLLNCLESSMMACGYFIFSIISEQVIFSSFFIGFCSWDWPISSDLL
ncbi:hypothetical protein L211DRAFT_555960 [Terfezia boudieri ATCC MYA-4762]|uniref:Uncharacterized protein n=1 Tax=Terfezia boudieri ATCC MYA-4762 TaxID=1051890 RepID=A0A3N4M3Q5_9PEZI|nr:hypothetical protein L211DRAFT_555960 [Terfezia boudieri ATCC MYA-4762]